MSSKLRTRRGATGIIQFKTVCPTIVKTKRLLHVPWFGFPLRTCSLVTFQLTTQPQSTPKFDESVAHNETASTCHKRSHHCSTQDLCALRHDHAEGLQKKKNLVREHRLPLQVGISNQGAEVVVYMSCNHNYCAGHYLQLFFSVLSSAIPFATLSKISRLLLP